MIKIVALLFYVQLLFGTELNEYSSEKWHDVWDCPDQRGAFSIRSRDKQMDCFQNGARFDSCDVTFKLETAHTCENVREAVAECGIELFFKVSDMDTWHRNEETETYLLNLRSAENNTTHKIRWYTTEAYETTHVRDGELTCHIKALLD